MTARADRNHVGRPCVVPARDPERDRVRAARKMFPSRSPSGRDRTSEIAAYLGLTYRRVQTHLEIIHSEDEGRQLHAELARARETIRCSCGCAYGDHSARPPHRCLECVAGKCDRFQKG